MALIYGAASGLFTAEVAGSKGYSKGLWFFLGLFFPIFSLLAIGFCENVIDQDRIEVLQGFKGKYFKRCKNCSELLSINVNQCKYCISGNIPTLMKDNSDNVPITNKSKLDIPEDDEAIAQKRHEEAIERRKRRMNE